MIPAVAQTVANALVAGTSLTSSDQIGFGHPGFHGGSKPCLNLYIYELQAAQKAPCPAHFKEAEFSQSSSSIQSDSRLIWVDIAFLITASDHTNLGEQHLLSESLAFLSHHQALPEEFIAPLLQGYGALPMRVSVMSLLEKAVFWNAIGIPLRSALHLIVTAPCRQGGLVQADLAGASLPN